MVSDISVPFQVEWCIYHLVHYIVVGSMMIYKQERVETMSMECGSTKYLIANSLWSSDAIWCYGPESTLGQVIACCLTAISHYLNQCWRKALGSYTIDLKAITWTLAVRLNVIITKPQWLIEISQIIFGEIGIQRPQFLSSECIWICRLRYFQKKTRWIMAWSLLAIF